LAAATAALIGAAAEMAAVPAARAAPIASIAPVVQSLVLVIVLPVFSFVMGDGNSKSTGERPNPASSSKHPPSG